MSIKRIQGRPKQGDCQVGRERIISGFVDMVRSGSYDEISRKQIALSVGITPALITYYFPKGDFLIKEALTPVFLQWYAEFDEILLRKDTSWDTRLILSIGLIIDLYKKEVHVESTYKNLCRKGVISHSTLDAMKMRLVEFLAERITVEETNSDLLESMANLIWGACQHCAPLRRSDFVFDMIEQIIDNRSKCTTGPALPKRAPCKSPDFYPGREAQSAVSMADAADGSARKKALTRV